MLISLSKQFFGLLLISILLWRCNDPILVGGDLLDDEKLRLGYTEDFVLHTRTEAGERIPTHIPALDSRTYLLGQLNDPVFGSIETGLYLYNVLQPGSKPTFTTTSALVTFDSLVLVLQLDSTVQYGTQNDRHRFEVYKLTANYKPADTFYSDTQLEFIPDLLVNKTIEVRPRDSVSYTDHISRNEVKGPAQVRLRLRDDFGMDLIRNNEAAINDTAFINFMKGFYIRATPESGSSLFGLNLSNSAIESSAPINKLIMYYTENDTVRKTYEYLINFATINQFVHKREGSQAASFIQNPEMGDSLTFIQGLGGVRTVVNFSDISVINNRNINNATLELTVANISNPPGIYTAPTQLIATYKDENDRTILIDDIQILMQRALDFRISFGGGLAAANGLNTYRLNVTNHLKRLQRTPGVSREIILSPALVKVEATRVLITESSIPNRAVLYGAKHSQYPVRLKVSFTEQ